MILLRKFGFFISLEETEAIALLKSIQRHEPWPDRSNVLSYLAHGHLYQSISCLIYDYLDPERPIASAVHIKTDGVWAWTEDVYYFYKNYH